MDGDAERCPHCGSTLLKWRLPEGSGWEELYHLVCFADECPYFVEGWNRTEAQLQRRASYRYRLNPRTGKSSPLPTWSSEAHRDRIISDEEVD